VQRAILAGDVVTGVSIMRMEEGLDTGPYCLQEVVPVDDLSAEELEAELAETGARALLDALDAIEQGRAIWTAQDSEGVTYADKITKTDTRPSPESSAEHVVRQVRASSRQAPARVLIGEGTVTLLAARAADDSVEPPGAGGVLAGRDGLLLGTRQGSVLVSTLKPGGKGAMPAADWARGARIERAVWRSV
jgi:methionyl-tRNA formyltransferase